MSANTTPETSNSNYDIEDFINQLLASQKFDELAEKVADKAVSKIKNIGSLPAHLEISDADSNSKTNKSEITYRQNFNTGSDEEEYNNNIKLRANAQVESLGKINTQTFMKTEALSQSENLKLKYKYLTKNAYENKLFNEQTDNVEHNPVLRNKYEKAERKSKENIKMGPNEDVLHNANTEGPVSNQDATEKEQRGPKKVIDEEDKYGKVEDDREEPDSNRNSNIHENTQKINENTLEEYTKIERSHEEPPPRPEKETRESRSYDRPEFNNLVRKEQVGLVRTVRGEETKQDKVLNSSAEKSKELDSDSQSIAGSEEIKKSTQEDDGEEKAKVLRVEEDSSSTDVEENISASMVDDNFNHSQETSLEPTTTTIITTKKPIFRIEGDKVYAFVTNPDYDEYHEEVAKLEKKEKGENKDYGDT